MEAAYRPGRPRPARDEILADPSIARYVTGWGREGDTALIAEEESPVGAAWYRVFRAEEPGFGFVDEDTPELSIAVVPERRREGIGSALLGALIDRAREDGRRALSLSVSPDNPAVSLYVRFGFARVPSRDDHWTMHLTLRQSEAGKAK